MALYTPFFEKTTANVGNAYLMKQRGQLAKDAYMGNPEALGELARIDPALAGQIKNQKMQEQQMQMSQQASQLSQQKSDQQWAMQNREIVQGVLEGAAKQGSFEQAQQYIAREVQALQQSGIQVPPSMSAQTFTPETFEQIRQAFGAAPDLGIVQRFKPDGTADTLQSDGKGGFVDMQGNPVQLAKEDRVIEGSNLTGGASELGLTNKEAEELRNAEIATLNFADSVDDAITLLDASPDINTFVAKGASIVNNIQQELKAAGRAFAVELDETLLDPQTHADTFDKLGIDNVRMQSLVTALAYHQAKANNPDGRISNADLSRAIEEIGAASDPRAFATTLQDVLKRTVRGYQNQYRVKMKNDYQGELLNRLGDGRGEALQTYIDQGLTEAEAQELYDLEQRYGGR